MRRVKRGTPVRCQTPQGPLYAVVYDRQLPRERERGLVYVRIAVDHPMGKRGRRVHVYLATVTRRTPGAHALRRRSQRQPQIRLGLVLP